MNCNSEPKKKPPLFLPLISSTASSETYNFVGLFRSCKLTHKRSPIINCKNLIGLIKGKVAFLGLPKSGLEKVEPEMEVISKKIGYEFRKKPSHAAKSANVSRISENPQLFPTRHNNSPVAAAESPQPKPRAVIVLSKRKPLLIKRAIKPAAVSPSESRKQSVCDPALIINFGNKL